MPEKCSFLVNCFFFARPGPKRERERADGVFFGLQDGTSKDKREMNCEQKY